MTTLSTKLSVLAFAGLAIAAQACTLASPTEVTMVPASQDSDATEAKKSKGDDSDSDDSSSAAKAASCKLAKVDVSKLTACGEGAGHCYPKTKVPGDTSRLMACDKADELCIPDTTLKAGGGKLTSCKVAVLSGAAGACMPLSTMPEGSDKDQAAANLKQDVCAAGEICAPCKDPTKGNVDTGLCGAVGVSEDVCSGGAAGGDTTTTPAPAAATCCGGKGTCSALGEAGEKLEKDTCTGDLVCAPASLTQGKATKCSAIIGDGICMDACFSSMLKLGGMILGQDTCGSGESCIPCMFASQMAPDGAKVPGCE